MQEALQQFGHANTSGLNGIFMSMLLLWGVWPIVCAALGARKGQALKGFMNGLLWGPIGLLFILLSSKKHRCPTCGCMTMTHPIETGDNLAGLPTARLALPQSGVISTPPPMLASRSLASGAVAAPSQPFSPPNPLPIPPPSTPVESQPANEADRLYDWVNAEPPRQVPAAPALITVPS